MKQRNVVILGGLLLAISLSGGTTVNAESCQNDSLLAGVSKDFYSMLSAGVETHQRDIVQANQEINVLYQGYASTLLNVRSAPSIESSILGKLSFNDLVEYSEFNEEWVKIRYNEGYAYVYKQYIVDSKCDFYSVYIPKHKDFKSYMSYNAIKSWKQKDLQNVAYTGDFGIRMVDGRCCVAVGAACNAEIGTYIDLVLENGVIIPAIVADIKADHDTQSNNLVTEANGCCSEFIVDTNLLPYAVRDSDMTGSGSISSCKEEWESSVTEIRVYDCNYFNK